MKTPIKKIKAAAIAAILVVMACATPEPSEQAKNGAKKLAPCPDSPNCVSSLDRRSAHRIAPLDYAGERNAALELLERIIATHKRARIVTRGSDYLHAQFVSAIFGFVDDVEFWFPPQAPIIHVRSASRTGYYDFGVNRRRIERIRARFHVD